MRQQKIEEEKLQQRKQAEEQRRKELVNTLTVDQIGRLFDDNFADCSIKTLIVSSYWNFACEVFLMSIYNIYHPLVITKCLPFLIYLRQV